MFDEDQLIKRSYVCASDPSNLMDAFCARFLALKTDRVSMEEVAFDRVCR